MDSTTYARAGVTVLSNDGSDATTSLRTSIRNLAAWANTYGLMFSSGLLASRPAAGTQGRMYFASDTPTVAYYDTGSTWWTLGAGAPADPAAGTPGLRTLGSGATQAAAGNHTHGEDAPRLTVIGAY